MSKVLKSGGGLTLVGDDIVVKIQITQSGKIMLDAPTVPPQVLCKMLSDLVIDIMYSSFKPAEPSSIEQL